MLIHVFVELNKTFFNQFTCLILCSSFTFFKIYLCSIFCYRDDVDNTLKRTPESSPPLKSRPYDTRIGCIIIIINAIVATSRVLQTVTQVCVSAKSQFLTGGAD